MPVILETLFVGPIEACCYILGDPETKAAAIIDPGGDGERILETVGSHGLQPQFIINTHGHYDHIGANNLVKTEYPDAQICVHPQDAAMLGRPGKNLSFLLGNNYRSTQPDRLLNEGDELNVGGLLLRVIHTPGHTEGGISLHCPQANCCFTGDLLFAGGVGRTDLPGGDEDTLLESIRQKIFPLGDETVVYPGHGASTTVGAERMTNSFLS